MLTEIQKIILTCLLGPEDTGAFKREKDRQRTALRPARRGASARRVVKESLKERLSKEGIKKCSRCQKEKPYSDFCSSTARPDGLRHYCRECSSAHQKKRWEENPEKVRKYHREEVCRRRQQNPGFRLRANLGHRLYDALRASGGKKAANTMALTGCPKVWLEVHLESQLKPGMTWENYGPVWHVDHIKPCAKFDLSDPEQQRICFHWTNLQPLFAAENLKKGDKYVS